MIFFDEKKLRTRMFLFGFAINGGIGKWRTAERCLVLAQLACKAAAPSVIRLTPHDKKNHGEQTTHNKTFESKDAKERFHNAKKSTKSNNPTTRTIDEYVYYKL